MLLAYDKYPMMQARKLEIYQIAIGNLSWENHGMEESRKRQRRQESAARIYGKLCRLKPDDLSFADWTKRAELNTSFFTNLKNGSDPSVTNLHSALDVIGVTPSEFYALDETPVVHLHSAVGFLKQRAETTVTFQSGKRHGNQAA